MGLAMAATFHGIGQAFASTAGESTSASFWSWTAENGAGHIFAHAIAGGVFSTLQGGKFGHGFLSAGISKGMDTKFNLGDSNGEIAAETVVVAVVGGTVSRATGGKFANGAITAGFAHLFNELKARKNSADGYREYDPTDPKYHDAPNFTLICDSAQQFGCTMQNVYENGLLYGPAPFSDLEGQVTHRQVLHLKGLGGVIVHRFDSEFRIVNATMADHLLHPGYVERQVIQIDSKIFIRSRGVGIGNLGGANAAFTGPLWTTQDQAIIRRLPGLYPNPYSSLP